jgi:predicted CoA-binding protein
MSTPQQTLQSAKTILVIDWPSKDVPESLVRAGFEVIVRGGPGPEDFSVYELKGDAIVGRRTGRAPENVDLVYSYRPLGELPGITDFAVKLHAKAIWSQSGVLPNGADDPRGCWLSPKDLDTARASVEAAGLSFVHEPYIGDVARELQLA